MKRLILPLVLFAALLVGCVGAPERALFSTEALAWVESVQEWGPQADAKHVRTLEAARVGNTEGLGPWREGVLQPIDEVTFNETYAGRVTLRFEGPWAVYAPMEEPAATVLYLHGGGWAVGDARLCEGFCAAMAEGAQAEVWSLNYPLAPEHPFPTQPHYVAERLKALRARFPWRPLFVAGDSAGGNLAVAAELLAPGLADGLILAYPALDLANEVRPEAALYGDVLALTRSLMEAFARVYVDDRVAEKDPIASPLLADDSALKAFPPVLTLAAECDLLAGQSRVFHERLAALGRTQDTRHVVKGAVHGFLSFPTMIDAQTDAARAANIWLREHTAR